MTTTPTPNDPSVRRSVAGYLLVSEDDVAEIVAILRRLGRAGLTFSAAASVQAPRWEVGDAQWALDHARHLREQVADAVLLAEVETSTSAGIAISAERRTEHVRLLRTLHSRLCRVDGRHYSTRP